MNKALKIILGLILTVIIIVFGFIIYDRITSDNTYTISEKNLKIPIFVYHDIVENEDEVEFDYMQISKETFEEQILGLMKLGYKPISYEELIAYSKGDIAISKKSFLITFDDGFDGVYRYAYPFAKEHNIPITSFTINNYIGKEGYFSWEDAREMDKSGVVSIYSHSLKHDEYNKYLSQDLLQDVTESLTNIEKELGHDITKVFTYPYGLYNEEGQKLLKENGIVQNLTDNKINKSNKLNIYGLSRMYPLNDPVWKIILKIEYRSIRY